MKRKRLIMLVSLILIMILGSITFVSANTDAKWSLSVDGKNASYKNLTVKEIQGHTFIPARDTIVALGGNVQWDNSDKSVLVTYKNDLWKFYTDKNYTTVNGNMVITDVSVILDGGTSYIPLDYITSYYKLYLDVNKASKLINIISKFDVARIYQDNSFIENKFTYSDLQKIENFVKTSSTRNNVIYKKLDYADYSTIDKLLNDVYNDEVTFEENLMDGGDVTSYFGELASNTLIDKYTNHKLLLKNSKIKASFEPAAFYRLKLDVYVIGGYVNYENLDDFNATEWLVEYVDNFQETTGEIMRREVVSGISKKLNEAIQECKNDRIFKIFIIEGNNIQGIY